MIRPGVSPMVLFLVSKLDWATERTPIHVSLRTTDEFVSNWVLLWVDDCKWAWANKFENNNNLIYLG